LRADMLSPEPSAEPPAAAPDVEPAAAAAREGYGLGAAVGLGHGGAAMFAFLAAVGDPA